MSGWGPTRPQRHVRVDSVLSPDFDIARRGRHGSSVPGHWPPSGSSRNGSYGILDRALSAYSALMLAARITLPHFSVSSAMSLPKSAGEPGSAYRPVGKPRPDLGIGEAGIDLLVELIDDLSGRVLRRANAEPCARLVARHEFAHGRDVRQHLRARRGRHRQRAQLASPDVLDRWTAEVSNITCTCPPSRSVSAGADRDRARGSCRPRSSS